MESELKTSFTDGAGVRLLDQVSIDYPYRVLPPPGNDYVTTVDTAIIGQSKINAVNGAIKIDPNILWKVIGITHNLKNMTTQLKLRQTGKKYGEGIA